MAYGRSYGSTRRTTRRNSFSRKRPYQARPAAATTIQRAVRTYKKRQFQKRVQRAVGPLLERKTHSTVLFGSVSTLGSITGVNVPGAGLGSGVVNTGGAYISNIWPGIVFNPGVGIKQRIGTEINNCRMTAKVFVTALPYSTTYNSSPYPKDLYMVLLRDRTNQTCTPDKLKIQVNGSAYYIDGNAQNMMLPWNTEKYIIHSCKRIARFKPPQVAQTLAAGDDQLVATLNPTFGSTTNKAFRSFGCRLPCPKTLRFSPQYGGATTAPVDNTVSNASLAMGFFWIDGSGAARASDQIPFQVSVVSTITYTDS